MHVQMHQHVYTKCNIYVTFFNDRSGGGGRRGSGGSGGGGPGRGGQKRKRGFEHTDEQKDEIRRIFLSTLAGIMAQIWFAMVRIILYHIT